jgi:hypothetical protein
MNNSFEMTQEDFDVIMDACKPVPMIAINCGPESSTQKSANNAWERLGNKMGFYHLTVRPNGSNQKRFYANPKCRGIEIEEGVYSGCNQSAGDCPSCGK